MPDKAQAIYAYCLTCSDGGPEDVERCPFDTCPLHPFRKEAMPEQEPKPVKRRVPNVKRKRRREAHNTAQEGDSETTEGGDV